MSEKPGKDHSGWYLWYLLQYCCLILGHNSHNAYQMLVFYESNNFWKEIKQLIQPAHLGCMIWLGKSGRGWVLFMNVKITAKCAAGARIHSIIICGSGCIIMPHQLITARVLVSAVQGSHWIISIVAWLGFLQRVPDVKSAPSYWQSAFSNPQSKIEVLASN